MGGRRVGVSGRGATGRTASAAYLVRYPVGSVDGRLVAGVGMDAAGPIGLAESLGAAGLGRDPVVAVGRGIMPRLVGATLRADGWRQRGGSGDRDRTVTRRRP